MHDQNERSRLLKTSHYAGLKFQEGWFFVHILDTEFIELKPWTLLNENEERAEIAPHTAGSEDDEVVDAVNRKLVTPRNNEQNLIFQLQVGVAPSRIQVYPFFGRDRSPNLTGGAEPGTPQIPLTGFDSPYNNPTRQGEIFTVNNIDDLALQAYNPMDEAQEARVSFHVNKMRYMAVDDVDTMKAFIQGQIPFRDHTMGLAAQDREQVRAPGWLMDKFGDLIMPTDEILEQGGSSRGTGGSTSGVAGAVSDNIPERENNGS